MKTVIVNFRDKTYDALTNAIEKSELCDIGVLIEAYMGLLALKYKSNSVDLACSIMGLSLSIDKEFRKEMEDDKKHNKQ